MFEEHVSLRVRLRVSPNNVARLLKSALECNESLGEHVAVEDALKTLCLCPYEASNLVGYEIERTEIAVLPDESIYHLLVHARVIDRERVITLAKERHAKRWGKVPAEFDYLVDALCSLVLVPDAKRSSVEQGFEFIGWSPLRS